MVAVPPLPQGQRLCVCDLRRLGHLHLPKTIIKDKTFQASEIFRKVHQLEGLFSQTGQNKGESNWNDGHDKTLRSQTRRKTSQWEGRCQKHRQCLLGIAEKTRRQVFQTRSKAYRTMIKENVIIINSKNQRD